MFENGAVCEVMRETVIKLDSPQMTIWFLHTACWITEATETHSEYVIHIVFPLQRWLHKHFSMLCYVYIVCLAIVKKSDKYKCLYITHTHTHTCCIKMH